MHPLHDYIANQIGDRIKDRRVVVMYDKREELRPFFAEIADGQSVNGGFAEVSFGRRKANLYVFDGSLLKTRFAVEDLTSGDQPHDVVVYVPGLDRDAKGSLLMELEKAGTFYQQPALKQFARLVLRKRFTDVAIDEMLKSDMLSYADLAGMAQDEGGAGQGASLLKSVFGSSDTVAIFTDWLGGPSFDADIQAKGAFGELRDAALARIGLALPADATLARARQITLRYVLANEFRSDLESEAVLQGQAAAAIKNVAEAKTNDHQKAIREVAKRLRESYSTAYVEAADKIEGELGLSPASVSGTALGSIDTFRFEEAAVVAACFDLIASEKFEQAGALMGSRESSFWVNREVTRKSVWAVCKLMVDLGLVAAAVEATVAKANGNGRHVHPPLQLLEQREGPIDREKRSGPRDQDDILRGDRIGRHAGRDEVHQRRIFLKDVRNGLDGFLDRSRPLRFVPVLKGALRCHGFRETLGQRDARNPLALLCQAGGQHRQFPAQRVLVLRIVPEECIRHIVVGADLGAWVRSRQMGLQVIAQALLEIGHAATLSAHSNALLNGSPTWAMLPATS